MNFMPEVHTPQVFRQHTKILVKYIVFLENQHAQGKTYISNYGIKAINYNKLPSPIMNSLSTPLSRSHSSIQTLSSIYQIEDNLV